MPKKNNDKNFIKSIKPYIIGVSKGFGLFSVLFICTALIMYKFNFDNQAMYYLIYLFIIFGSFVCAVSVYKKVRGRGFLTGIISSLPYSALVFLLICAINAFNISGNILLVFLLTLSGGFLGGITAANTKL